jgi:hypothetical protein
VVTVQQLTRPHSMRLRQNRTMGGVGGLRNRTRCGRVSCGNVVTDHHLVGHTALRSRPGALPRSSHFLPYYCPFSDFEAAARDPAELAAAK